MTVEVKNPLLPFGLVAKEEIFSLCVLSQIGVVIWTLQFVFVYQLLCDRTIIVNYCNVQYNSILKQLGSACHHFLQDKYQS